MRLRVARREDADALTRLVRCSSAYSGEYHGIVRDLTVSSAYIARGTVYVCEANSRVVGFYSLIRGEEDPELDLMFVADDVRGLGIGRKLFEHMRKTAKELGHEAVFIVAHPPAEAFYQRLGAVTIGVKPPSGRISWSRPKMKLLV